MTLPFFGQPIWGHIWKRTLEKNQTNAASVTLPVLSLTQVLWGDTWRGTDPVTICHCTMQKLKNGVKSSHDDDDYISWLQARAPLHLNLKTTRRVLSIPSDPYQALKIFYTKTCKTTESESENPQTGVQQTKIPILAFSAINAKSSVSR